MPAALFVAAFAFLLASFPARNPDVWGHLATGRDLAGGKVRAMTTTRAPESKTTSGWVYNLTAYALYSAVGGAGLVLVKAGLVVGTALLLLRLSRARPGWVVPVFCTGLALLAMSSRLLLQPATVSYFFLAVAVWLAWRPERADRVTPLVPWPLLALFLIWANTDRWFVVGLGTVALSWLGQTLDEPGPGRLRVGVRRAGGLAAIAAVCLLNPSHVSAFTLAPALIAPTSTSTARPVTSPFESGYLDIVSESPAAMAYFPLLGLGLLSFPLAWSGWRWARFLPWVGLAVLSAVQVRTVPFFAVVAGPVLARNLQDFFAGREAAGSPAVVSRRGRLALGALTGLVGLAFLACAWPGWLQAPPFEPRRWAIDAPPALRRGGDAVCRWYADGRFGGDARGLHLSQEGATAFVWWCPDAKGVYDEALAVAVREGKSDELAAGLRAAGINHLIVYDPDRDRLFAALRGLLADPDQWPLLLLEGDLAVFGWRDPARRGGADPFRGAELDFDRLALRPGPGERAPADRPARDARPRRWWEAFWKPLPPRPLDRDAATLHLFHAEALRESAPVRHFAAWEATQVAGLVGSAAAGGGVGQILDVHTRLMFFRPPLSRPGVSPDPLGGLGLAFRPVLVHRRDDSPMAILYLAIRAARRALADNPEDARAYAVLGQCYHRLLHNTRERAWVGQLAEVGRLRRVQAAAALTRAVTLDPDLIQAHESLGALYAELGYMDLALKHQRAHLHGIRKAGPPRGADPTRFREALAEAEGRLDRLADLVDSQERAHAQEAAGLRVLDRAALAAERGLAGKALDVLLQSDISAFGAAGMALELELLLRTGRVAEVREWTGAELQGALGPNYHWLRVQAFAASGDYSRAQAECRLLAGEGPGPRRGPRAELAALVARAALDGQPGAAGLDWVFGRAFPRVDFHRHLTGLAASIRREADASVLRGLLALEAGDVDEAEVAFRLALDTWVDEAAAADGRGLDFNARPVAQDCLKWLDGRGP